MSLELVPVSLAEARRFVASHHRHNGPPVTWKFGVGAEKDGQLVGVAMAGLPKARMLMDGRTLEVNRVCTFGERNVCSLLYGAVARAAKALGYRRLITYTLATEPGASLKASGWTADALLDRDDAWERHPNTQRPQRDLFGNERNPLGPKVRWLKEVA